MLLESKKANASQRIVFIKVLKLIDLTRFLEEKNKDLTNWSRKCETLLNSTQKQLTQANESIVELKTENILIKKQDFSKIQTIELKDKAINDLQNKVEKLNNKILTLKKDLDKANEIIKEQNHSIFEYKSLLKNQKSPIQYLKGKSEKC